MKSHLLAAMISLALFLPAVAQDHSAMAGMATSDNPAITAFRAANMQMHDDMSVELTGDVDVDFVRQMIPHHQGAVEMARIVLQYGSEPQVKALAESVIAAQEAEIAMMQDWLSGKGF